MINTPNFKRAVIYMTLYAIIQSVVWGMVRYLGEDLSTATIYFFRNLIGFVSILPLISKSGLKVFQTSNIQLHLLRAFAAFAGGLSIFYAVSHAPLATVVAITFAAPILATAFAVYFLGEVMSKAKMVSLLIGFLGVTIILRPSLDIDTSGLISSILAAIMTAIAFITVKKLSHTESSSTIIAYPFLLILPLSTVIVFADWTPPSWEHIPLLLMMGLGISSAQYCMVKAFAIADASAVLPFDFLRLLVATFIGSFFFSDVIDLWVIVGGALILTSSIYVARTGKNKKEETTN